MRHGYIIIYIIYTYFVRRSPAVPISMPTIRACFRSAALCGCLVSPSFAVFISVRVSADTASVWFYIIVIIIISIIIDRLLLLITCCRSVPQETSCRSRFILYIILLCYIIFINGYTGNLYISSLVVYYWYFILSPSSHTGASRRNRPPNIVGVTRR